MSTSKIYNGNRTQGHAGSQQPCNNTLCMEKNGSAGYITLKEALERAHSQ